LRDRIKEYAAAIAKLELAPTEFVHPGEITPHARGKEGEVVGQRRNFVVADVDVGVLPPLGTALATAGALEAKGGNLQ
jgi:hypothetical protein